MFLDLQILTIYRDLRRTLPMFKGRVLDVGCGESPYRHLLDPALTTYTGIDIVDAKDFDYTNTDITPFDGKTIPFPDQSFEALICTEVLEHVLHHQELIGEMHRVLKPGGFGIITIPWSARYHYIPYDYFRYTPSSLKYLFREFSQTSITPRGSDIAVVANKLLVMWVRNLFPARKRYLPLIPFWILASPIPITAVIAAHLSLWFRLGSEDDPLGYTIHVSK
jgi:ubiquinone/menaquinone biosynthesis C-methylase UbiE